MQRTRCSRRHPRLARYYPNNKVNDLPLANRDVLALTSTMAGVVQGNQTASFPGSRTGAVQTLVNGVSVNDGRYQFERVPLWSAEWESEGILGL